MRTVPLVIVAGLFLAESAWACINGMKMEERKVDVVVKANEAYRAGRYAEALLVAEKGMAGVDSVRRRGLLRTIGLAGLRLGEFDKSVDALSALSKERFEPFIAVKLAEAQLRKATRAGSVDEAALGALEKFAADGLLSDADAWAAVAHAKSAQRDLEAAKRACEEALKIQPGHPEAQALLNSLTAPARPSDPTKPAKS